MVRKMPSNNSREVGLDSSLTNSWSSRSRFSLLSMRKSLMMSSMTLVQFRKTFAPLRFALTKDHLLGYVMQHFHVIGNHTKNLNAMLGNAFRADRGRAAVSSKKMHRPDRFPNLDRETWFLIKRNLSDPLVLSTWG